MILTAKKLENMADGSKLTDGGFDPDGLLKGRFKGSLIARRRAGRSNIEFYLRMRAEGSDKMHRIGTWAPSGGAGGITLSKAREQALELALQYAEEGATFKDKRAAEREADDLERARKAASEAGDDSLGALLLAYVDDLERRGKVSYRDVERAVRSKIEKKHPDLWGKPARTVTKADLMGLLSGMADEGITRRVNIMRSYLKTAYEFGIGMADDIHYFAKAQVFRVTENPAARIKRRPEFDNPGERVLSALELGHYLRRLDDVESLVTRVFLQLHIRLGGQRLTQLARAKWSDLREGNLVLIDSKGRGKPRDHLLPLSDANMKLVNKLKGLSDTWIFSSTGDVPMRPETASLAVTEIARAMIKEDEATEPFVASDLRRTAETMMASIGINKDTRTELLSHGRNSLVSKHYDLFQYLPAKRAALAKWSRTLDDWKRGKTGKVVVLRGGKTA